MARAAPYLVNVCKAKILNKVLKWPTKFLQAPDFSKSFIPYQKNKAVMKYEWLVDILIRSIWNFSLNFSHKEKSLYLGSANNYRLFPILSKAFHFNKSSKFYSFWKNSGFVASHLKSFPFSRITFKSWIYSIS